MKEKEFTDTEKKHNDMFRDDENKDHQISVNELWQKWKRSKGTFCKHAIISSLVGDFVYGNFCSGNIFQEWFLCAINNLVSFH